LFHVMNSFSVIPARTDHGILRAPDTRENDKQSRARNPGPLPLQRERRLRML
jgi:hypothetical protein